VTKSSETQLIVFQQTQAAKEQIKELEMQMKMKEHEHKIALMTKDLEQKMKISDMAGEKKDMANEAKMNELMNQVKFTNQLQEEKNLKHQELARLELKSMKEKHEQQIASQQQLMTVQLQLAEARSVPKFIPTLMPMAVGRIPYILTMSSKYNGPQNTYESLIDDNPNSGCGTVSSANQYIQATFANYQYVTSVWLAAPSGMDGGWSSGQVNNLQFQMSLDGVNWTTLFIVSGLRDNHPGRQFPVNQTCLHCRLFNPSGYVATGTLVFFNQ